MQQRIQIIITAIIIVLALGVGAWYFFGQTDGRQALERDVDEIHADAVGGIITGSQSDDLKAIAEDVADLYTRAVRDKNEKAAEHLREYLSPRGQTVFDRGDDPVDGVLRFSRYAEPPERVTIGNTTKKTDEFAEVETTWHYSEANSTPYYFYLTIRDGAWRLDSIQSVRQ